MPSPNTTKQYQEIQEIYLKWHDKHRPLSGFVNELEALINSAVVAELEKYKDTYVTDLNVDAYIALLDRIKQLKNGGRK